MIAQFQQQQKNPTGRKVWRRQAGSDRS